MAHQIFLVSLQTSHCDSDAVREDIALMVHGVGGFVLMAAGSDALLAVFDEQWVPLFRRHEAVAFCGGLSLDPKGSAANKLRHLFAANVAAQLATREPTASSARAAGPRHRPLVWHRPAFHDPASATGVSITTQPSQR